MYHELHHRSACRRSYTLIELLLVVGIMALAGALLVPHMIGRDVMAVQAAVRTIISDLTFAQADALANQAYRKVHFYTDGRGYCLLRVDNTTYDDAFDPATADYVTNPLGMDGYQNGYIVDFTLRDGYEGILIESVDIDNGNSAIVYDPMGGTIKAALGELPGSGGTIILASENERYEITIAPFTGKLTVKLLGS